MTTSTSPTLLLYIALAKREEENKMVQELKKIKLFLSVVNKNIYTEKPRKILQSLTKLQKSLLDTQNVICYAQEHFLHRR